MLHFLSPISHIIDTELDSTRIVSPVTQRKMEMSTAANLTFVVHIMWCFYPPPPDFIEAD